jgi:glycosyltransferase involved in cell wall biosynthesis
MEAGHGNALAFMRDVRLLLSGSGDEGSQRTNRRVRVCHIFGWTEGATWMVEQLLELRDRHGFEVSAVIAGDHGGLPDRLRAEGIPFNTADFPLPGQKRFLRLAAPALRLAAILRRERIDVVQTHSSVFTVVARLAAWIADVPVRLTMVTTPVYLGASTHRRIERATCWMDSAVIPSCEYSRSVYRQLGVSEDRLPVIYYGVDERRFDHESVVAANVRAEFGWNADSPVVAMIAYFYAPNSVSEHIPRSLWGKNIKGHEDLLCCVPSVLAEFPEAKFLIVGKGWGMEGERSAHWIESLVSRLRLQESVALAGYRTDVPNILKAVSVTVCTSLIENLDGSIESLLMGRPMVSTRVGGMPDAIRDGETGVLVRPADPEDLARGIRELLRDPSRARALGEAGRRLALIRFTLERTGRDLSALYRRLLVRNGIRVAGHRPATSVKRLLALPLILAQLEAGSPHRPDTEG